MDEKFLKFGKRFEETKELAKDADDLTHALWREYEREYENDVYHDWDFLYWRVVRNYLQPLRSMLVIEQATGHLNEMIQDDVPDEQIRFESEKAYRNHLRYMILPSVEGLIDIAKTMKFNDYRVQRFQLRLGEVMQEIKSAYDEILGEDEES